MSTPPIHILHALPCFATGGLGALALELLRAWPTPASGGRDPGEEDVHYAFAARYAALEPVMKPDFEMYCPGRVVEVPRSFDWPEPEPFVRKTVRALTPWLQHLDVVLIYSLMDLVWYRKPLQQAGYRGPVLCHVGFVVNPQDDRVRDTISSAYAKGTVFQPASEAVREALLAAGASEALTLCPRWNGVDLRRFAAQARPPADEVPAADGKGLVVFGFHGRMAPDEKDFPGLIRAYAALQDQAALRARLWLAGDGPARVQYEALAHQLGLVFGPKVVGPRSVRFLGDVARDAIPAFLQCLDCYVMAALPLEGMSMALVEAIATGLPVLATDVPSNREVVNGSRAGWLVASPSVEQSQRKLVPLGLAEAMETIIGEPEVQKRLAAASRAARGLFDVRAVAQSYRATLAQLARTVPRAAQASGEASGGA